MSINSANSIDKLIDPFLIAINNDKKRKVAPPPQAKTHDVAIEALRKKPCAENSSAFESPLKQLAAVCSIYHLITFSSATQALAKIEVNNQEALLQDGTRYIGQMKDGLFHGFGQVFDADGNLSFEGEFFEGKSDGQIRKFFPDGRSVKFRGTCSNGLMEGEGTFYYPDGSVRMVAVCKGGQVDGVGRMYYQGGKLAYTGQIYQEQPHGFGSLYSLETGIRVYEGNFDRSKRNGYGEIFTKHGKRIYVGEYLNDLKHGQGILYDINTGNIVFKGQFENGNAVDKADTKVLMNSSDIAN